MPHLATGADLSLAVKVQGGTRNAEPSSIVLDLVADQVDHFDAAAPDRLAKWPSSHRPDMLLELRHRGAVERPMTGIVHPRRDLVDQEAATIEHEEFNGQYADIAERLRDRLGDALRLLRGRPR